MYNFVAMKIESYIAQLLYRYQCVTVPGFGAFLTEIQSAQLNVNSNSFYPPKKLVSFNSFLKNNDGLLANHIAQAENFLRICRKCHTIRGF
jgi:CCDC81-like prokaryotic HU domain 1